MEELAVFLHEYAMKHTPSHSSRRQFLKWLGATATCGALAGIGFSRRGASTAMPTYSFSQYRLGTMITIMVQHPDYAEAKRATEAAYNAIGEVDSLMSLHRPESELNRLNALAGQSDLRVSPDLIDVVTTANDVYQLTHGAYDITCLPIMKRYGFYSDTGTHYPSDREMATLLDHVGQKWLTINPSTGTMGLQKSGAAIDLGSIGKGYAVDMAAKALRAAGIERAMVNAGGNIMAIGAPCDDDAGWKVAIRNPSGDTNDYFETITLKDAAIATSGNYENSVIIDGRKVGHIFDIRNGHPAASGVSATTVAPTATIADAMSTAAFVLGPTHTSTILTKATAAYFHGYIG